METVTVPRAEFEQLTQENEQLKQEVEVLRNAKLYKRLMECLQNLKSKEFTRKDLGI